MDVTQPGGQQRQAGLPVLAGGVGVEHRGDGEGVAQIVNARPAGRRARGASPGQSDQPVERVVDVAVEQPGPGRGHQQRRCPGGRREPVAEPLVAAQRVDGRGVQGQFPGLAVMRISA